jgi:glutathione S-transferase
VDVPLERGELAEQPRGGVEQARARRRGRHALSDAVEKARPQVALEVQQLVAHRRLRQVEAASGARDAPVGGDRLDEAEVPHLDPAWAGAVSIMRILHRSHANYALVSRRGARHLLRMDLYIHPMSGSFVAHVACLEAGAPHTLHRVDRRTKLLPDGRDYRAIAPLGIVTALNLPDGSVLTETAAILQYIADQAPDKELAPRWGTPERYRLIEWLSFISTELHKKHLWMIFSTRTPDAVKEWARSTAAASLAHAAAHLQGRKYLLGDRYTVADIYLFWALFVAPHGGVPLTSWPSLGAYVERIQARPAVKAALAVEGPLYAQEAAAGGAPKSQLQPSA